jgi:hypothetical protein
MRFIDLLHVKILSRQSEDMDRLVMKGTASRLIALPFIRYNNQTVVSNPGHALQITVYYAVFIIAGEKEQPAIVCEQIFQTIRMPVKAPDPHG